MKKLSKILLSLSLVLFLVGCGNMADTPTKKVEEFLGKYQSMDSDVMAQLDKVISDDENMSDKQKKNYRALLEKQYQNLSYKIKDEDINGDNATVDVEIEVLDYATAQEKAKKYYNEHKDEFEDKDDDSLVEGTEESLEKIASFIDYKIKQLQSVTDKTKYDITFNLKKENGKWKVQDLSDEDIEKLHGLYQS
ncbi:MAG: hypothetical protein IJF92_01455 [Bacilli bacterium]|nr:hypothetical protein [Bacilli bacterium]